MGVKKAVEIAVAAKSGNKCAYPGCNDIIFNEKNIRVGTLCHIEAQSPAGPRYNPDLTNEEMHGYDNLVFLCRKHHTESDYDLENYSVERLKTWKREHEANFQYDPYVIDGTHVYKTDYDFFAYTEDISNNIHRCEIPEEHKLDINLEMSFTDLMENINDNFILMHSIFDQLQKDAEDLNNTTVNLLKELGINTEKWDKLPYYNNPLKLWNWSYLNLGLPNIAHRIQLAIQAAQIQYLREFVKTNPTNHEMQDKYLDIMENFRNLAASPHYSD
ncbi:MAG: hypothetical protein FWG30_01400 [Eubacteriaceae bacterium]|nr:hypothetical protein [Eubacteriaceae bacterium]